MPANARLRPLGPGAEVLRKSRKTSQEVADLIDYCFGGGALTLVAARSSYAGKLHRNQGDPALKVIDSAHTSIRLAGYSFTSPKVVRGLLDAERRGVDVAVVVDDKGNRSKTSQQALNLLVNAGIPTRTIDR
ncbi:phosphatidylserine/phosphatidylglycerophosphate/cardiolipin synthase-like enzyme [Paraburkholderia sp. Clong3]